MFAYSMASQTLSSPCPPNASREIMGASSTISSSSSFNSMVSSRGSNKPCSPDSDSFSGLSDMVELTGLFNMKSPLSVLANDMDANLFLKSEFEAKTPRRCLLLDLETAIESPVGEYSFPLGICGAGIAGSSTHASIEESIENSAHSMDCKLHSPNPTVTTTAAKRTSQTKLARMNTASGRLETHGATSLFGINRRFEMATASSESLSHHDLNSSQTVASPQKRSTLYSQFNDSMHETPSKIPSRSANCIASPTSPALSDSSLTPGSFALKSSHYSDKDHTEPQTTHVDEATYVDADTPDTTTQHMFLDQNIFQRHAAESSSRSVQPLAPHAWCKNISAWPVQQQLPSQARSNHRTNTAIPEGGPSLKPERAIYTSLSTVSAASITSRVPGNPPSTASFASKARTSNAYGLHADSDSVFLPASKGLLVSNKPSRLNLFAKGGVAHWNQRTVKTAPAEHTLSTGIESPLVSCSPSPALSVSTSSPASSSSAMSLSLSFKPLGSSLSAAAREEGNASFTNHANTSQGSNTTNRSARFKLSTEHQLFCTTTTRPKQEKAIEKTFLFEKRLFSKHTNLPLARRQLSQQARLLRRSDDPSFEKQEDTLSCLVRDSSGLDSSLIKPRARPHSIMDMDLDARAVTTTVCQSIRHMQRSSPPPLKMRRANTVIGFGMSEHPEQPYLHCQDQPSYSGPSTLSEEEILLPSVLEPGKDMIRRISVDTLAKVMDGHFDQIDTFHLVDCRYKYEYTGGHIASSCNVTSVQDLDHYFQTPPKNNKTVIVFHCEYSAQRAPQMALHFRSMDRNINAMEYPKLHYPHIYVLSGGYREFYASYMSRCEPQGYVEMTDKSYIEEYKAGVIQNRRQFRKAFSDGFLR
ncbi:hypothetical protein BASA83_005713 [Batrachochytrium salamandrivorans]|nr:hypothetical protein BASA83_005713 [Batrachochytrium salamandrivorans]